MAESLYEKTVIFPEEVWEVIRRVAGCGCSEWTVEKVRNHECAPAFQHLLDVHLTAPCPASEAPRG